MAFPNVTDLVATTIENRHPDIADNVLNNNVLLKQMEADNNIEEVGGGTLIFEDLSFAANTNAMFYSGYDVLAVDAADVISAAQFSFKQAACAVVISGLEMLENDGEQALIDLITARVGVAEASMANLLTVGMYSDGTLYGGKAINGLGIAVVANPTTGVYGSIDPSVWTFWQNQTGGPGGQTTTASNIQSYMNQLWAKCIRGKDRPNMIIFDNNLWSFYQSSLQAQQRFMDPKKGELGFPSIKFQDADVYLDGGIGGQDPAYTGYFLNTKYLKYRPHKKRNLVALNPERRYAINQDAEVQILAWAGNMTCSGRKFQGYFNG